MTKNQNASGYLTAECGQRRLRRLLVHVRDSRRTRPGREWGKYWLVALLFQVNN